MQAKAKVESERKEANFVAEVEKLTLEAGVAVKKTLKLSEYQLVRECLWMALRPADTTVFERREGSFRMCGNVCIPSATSEMIGSSLRKFCSMLDKLRCLMEFRDQVLGEQTKTESDVPFTYEAYASAVGEVLYLFSSDVLKLEDLVKKQEETFTLLDFESEMATWYDTINQLFLAHEVSVIQYWKESGLENWKKAVKLLGGLSQCLVSTYKETSFNFLLNIFLKTCTPYIRIIGLWLSEGRLEDFRYEFVIEENKSHAKETFWDQRFKLRPFEEFLNECKMKLPEMLAETIPRILISGKSIEILTSLHKDGFPGVDRVVFPSSSHKDLFGTFVDNIKKCLNDPKDRVDFAVPANSLTMNRFKFLRSQSHLDHQDLDLDPYLSMAFAEVTDFHERSDDVDGGSEFYLLSKIDPLLPISPIFTRSFTPMIDIFYKISCQSLLNLVKNSLELENHLSSVRRVFLMEAGDLMFEFYTDVFRRLDDESEDLDSPSATLFLQDCIARRYPEEAERFRIDFVMQDDQDTFSLEKTALLYDIEWPLSIVLHEESLKKYSKVFVFLMRVKQSLWALQQIKAKDLAETLGFEEEEKSFEEDSLRRNAEEEDEDSPSLKMHRILLLRSWLFHFVGNVHSYFMTRVLHSTELELKSDLAECRDLDQIISVHDAYIDRIHDRCFLHSSAKVLRDAVGKVLKLCMDLLELCRATPVPKVRMRTMTRLEETYVRSHQFLASTLDSMTRRRNVPHLDGLAAALLHSCPDKADSVKK